MKKRTLFYFIYDKFTFDIVDVTRISGDVDEILDIYGRDRYSVYVSDCHNLIPFYKKFLLSVRDV